MRSRSAHESSRLRQDPRRHQRSRPRLTVSKAAHPTREGVAAVLAARIHRFGAPEVIVCEEVAPPVPTAGELLVRIGAAGVGPWDGWVRAGRSPLPQTLPLTLGADIAGRVEAVGADARGFAVGDAVFGVGNAQLTGGYAEYSAASVSMMAPKPRTLDDFQAASLPVAAVTAQQMLFERALLRRGQRVVVHGAAGGVGRCAIQLARRRGLHVIAGAAAADRDALLALGADEVIDASALPIEQAISPVDAVLDLVGGAVQERSFAMLKPDGILVSAVSAPDQARAERHGVRATFSLVDINTPCLMRLAAMADAGDLAGFVGAVLPLTAARAAHEMLDAARPRAHGRIVLDVAGARG
jgi:NADPH:quinone reductase-like Zn-dependent oxidoreductase